MDALKFSTFTNNIHYKSREEADAAVSQPDGPKVAYFIKKITGPMDCQDADVLVGFYSSETTSFRVKIGDKYLPSRELLVEHFVFATEDSIVPLLKLVYHNLVLDTGKPVDMYGVFACLPQSDRILLVNSEVRNGTHRYSSGLFGITQPCLHTPKYEEFSDAQKFTDGFFIKKFLSELPQTTVVRYIVNGVTLSKSDVTFDPKMMERLFDVIEKTSWRDLPDDISKWISTVSDGNVNFIEMNQTPFSYTLFGNNFEVQMTRVCNTEPPFSHTELKIPDDIVDKEEMTPAPQDFINYYDRIAFVKAKTTTDQTRVMVETFDAGGAKLLTWKVPHLKT